MLFFCRVSLRIEINVIILHSHFQVLDNMDDLVFFKNLSSGNMQSENVLSKYVTEFENMVHFCGVSKFW